MKQQSTHPFLEIVVSLGVIVWAIFDWHGWLNGGYSGPLGATLALAIAPVMLVDGVGVYFRRRRGIGCSRHG